MAAVSQNVPVRELAAVGHRLLHVPVLRDQSVREPPDVHDGDAGPPVRPGADDIAMPIRIRHDGSEPSLISMIATFGTAFDVTLDEIVVAATGDALRRTGRRPRPTPG